MRFSQTLEQLLKSATNVVALTGAGVSAESGLPTFRGQDGLWKKFKPEELASFAAFQKNPEIVWEWYQHRREVLKNARPNPGHDALVVFENFFPKFTLITQNVDGLHRRAGSKNVLELHGNIQRNRCLGCGQLADAVDLSSEEIPPRCRCGGRLRPDVVWFGELLPEQTLKQAFQAAERAQLFFTIGTSAAVHPAASLPIVASEHGAYVVEINPEETEISYLVAESLRGTSATILTELAAYLGVSVVGTDGIA